MLLLTFYFNGKAPGAWVLQSRSPFIDFANAFLFLQALPGVNNRVELASPMLRSSIEHLFVNVTNTIYSSKLICRITYILSLSVLKSTKNIKN